MNYNLNSNNYYEILGVKPDADQKTIKKAYHKLAIKYHPDKNTNQDKKEEYEQLFRKIHHAYKCLSNDDDRNHYNNTQNTNNFNNEFFNKTNNNSDMFNQFFKTNFSTQFETNTFSYSFSNLDGNIDVNYNYSTYTNFGDEYNKMNNHLKKFKNQEAQFFNKKDFKLKIPNSTKVLIKSKNITGYIKDFKDNFYRIYCEEDGLDYEIPFDDIQQILKGKFVNLKGEYSHLNDDYADMLNFNTQYNKFLINIYDCDLVINPENIIINNNSFVKIYNLKNKKELNGKWGIINAYDFNEKKYLVQLSENNTVKVSYKNVIF